MKQEQKKLKSQYKELFSKVTAIMNSVDPMNLFPGPPDDEYSREVTKVIAALPKATSVNEFAILINNIIVESFDLNNKELHRKDVEIAVKIWGIKEDYRV